jgi:hypothetical protein
MARRTLSVSTPFGTFTRTTERPYTHLVVSCGSVESHLVARQTAELNYTKHEIARYRAIATGERTNPFPSSCSIEDYLKWIAGYQQGLEAMPEKHAQELEENRRRIREQEGGVIGWSQSLQNAQKAAQSARNRGIIVAGIFPVDAPV